MSYNSDNDRAIGIRIIVNVIQVVGSLASITGVTLLWARDSIDVAKLADAVTPVSMFILIFAGGLTIIFAAFFIGFNEVRKMFPWWIRLIYLCLAGAVTIWIINFFVRHLYIWMNLQSIFGHSKL